jgi:hypothetical protein
VENVKKTEPGKRKHLIFIITTSREYFGSRRADRYRCPDFKGGSVLCVAA